MDDDVVARVVTQIESVTVGDPFDPSVLTGPVVNAAACERILGVIARAVAGEALPGRSLTRAEMRRAQALMPEDPARANAWNAAVMELGALVCTARSPACGAACRRPARRSPAPALAR